MTELRLICDEMLFRLGRWLRAAGYDTVIAENGMADRAIIQQARDEGRLLVTRDRKLVEHRDTAGLVILLQGNRVDECVVELSRKLPIDWQHKPFSRCMVCNAPLIQLGPESLSEVPDISRDFVDEAYRCSGCQRLYWEGSHVRRMRRQLEKWQKLTHSDTD